MSFCWFLFRFVFYQTLVNSKCLHRFTCCWCLASNLFFFPFLLPLFLSSMTSCLVKSAKHRMSGKGALNDHDGPDDYDDNQDDYYEGITEEDLETFVGSCPLCKGHVVEGFCSACQSSSLLSPLESSGLQRTRSSRCSKALAPRDRSVAGSSQLSDPRE
jgi:hypothetical protein